MYFFHCRKIDKNRQRQLYEKYNKQQHAERSHKTTSTSPNHQFEHDDDTNEDDDHDVVDDADGDDVAEEDGDEMDSDVATEVDQVHEGDVSHRNERDRTQRTGYARQTDQLDVVEADYEEVQGKDANFKTNTKYK
jgi:hypothetical protein